MRSRRTLNCLGSGSSGGSDLVELAKDLGLNAFQIVGWPGGRVERANCFVLELRAPRVPRKGHACGLPGTLLSALFGGIRVKAIPASFQAAPQNVVVPAI